MPGLDPVVFLSPSSIGTAIEVTVASLASPTELNSISASQGDLVITRTVAAGTDDCVIYYADTTSDAQSLPYIVTSATSGVKFIAIAGRYRNGTSAIAALTASRVVATDASKNLGTPATVTTGQAWAFTSTLTVVDGNLTITGSADATKALKFEVDAQTANDTLTINSGAQTDSRTLSVPVLTADATLMVLSETQTVSGAKTFTTTIKGTKSGSGTVAALVLEGGDPIGTAWKFTGGGTDAKTWDLIVTTNEMRWRLNNDAEDNSATWLSVIRSGLSLTSITLGNATSGQVIIPATTGITLSIASTNAASITTAGGVQVANGATATPSFNFAGASSSGLTYSSGVAICEAATRIVTFANGAVTFSTAAPTTFQNTTTSASVILSGGMQLATSKNLRMGTAAIATNATDGFLYVSTCSGTPTGTPTTLAGTAPIVIDTTNNKLYFYSGGAWRDAGP